MSTISSVQTAAIRTASSQTSAAVAKPAIESKPSLTRKPGNPFTDSGSFPLHKPPFLQPSDAKVRANQGNQLHDIAGGTRNGSITAQEGEKLLQEQQKIADATRQAMSDGLLTVAEQLKLGLMQAQAQAHISEARGNGDRSLLAGLDSNAQRQADQIDRLANGRTNGTITNSEAGELLGQQVGVADARGDADTVAERQALGGKLDNADKELSRHSAPGTQFDWKPVPFPRPVPIKPIPVPLFRNAPIAG